VERISRAGILSAVFALAIAAPASASVSLTPSLATSSGKTRLVIAISSTKAFTARTTPRGVTASGGGKTFTLSRQTLRSRSSTWRTAAYTGRAAAALRGLLGKRITVKVRSNAGTTTLRRLLPAPKTVLPPTPPSSKPLFDPPGRELSGQEATPFLAKYFIDSRFTDCPAGWPNCSVEERYVHCPDGTFRYRRLTPTSGADINTVGTYQPSGALVHADGSWIVEYHTATYGNDHFYHWEVSTNGTVVGTYDNSQRLGPLKWQQPAGDC
jgi:hypothetical protein